MMHFLCFIAAVGSAIFAVNEFTLWFRATPPWAVAMLWGCNAIALFAAAIH